MPGEYGPPLWDLRQARTICPAERRMFEGIYRCRGLVAGHPARHNLQLFRRRLVKGGSDGAA